MSAFFESLWNSIFTPGPTPPLLLATNVTFASLQLVLFILLVATYSIHFVILSFLSGGLWWAINWFAAELVAAQKAEEEEKARKAGGTRSTKAGDSGDGSNTEADESLNSSRSLGSRGTTPVPSGDQTVTQGSLARATGSATLQPLPEDDVVRKRRSLADSSGDISTDSEWEKVEDDR